MSHVRIALRSLLSSAVLVASMAQVQSDALTRAREAYNGKKFDLAIAAAREAMKSPSTANAGAVVLGRALLERHRSSFELSDLNEARDVFAEVRPAELSPRDRLDFIMGLGVALYLDGCTDGCLGAAAEFFEQAMQRTGPDHPEQREIAFEWWANALHRQALSAQTDEERAVVFRRILTRAEEERARRDTSTSAPFWIASAARSLGDFERAWSAAVAGWINARYQGPAGKTLRNELDRFVVEVLLPERSKALVPDADPRPQLAQLIKQWDEIKARYK